MTNNASFFRKIVYGCAIILLLFPLFLLGQPATRSVGADGERGSGGGVLARMRSNFGLSQAELGEIDPASETMKMATLGLRGVATNILWTKANRYKRTESWDRLSATLNQIAKLQPNYITVWEFQAHNLSYNVSAEFDDYRHRYHWVKKGIEFLMEGTRYNQRNPRLFWNIGWFSGHKIGRADEAEQFRREFRQDADFHNTMASFIGRDEMDKTRFEGYPDNWLVAYRWYLQSEAVVEKGVPVTWMALIGHADAVTQDVEPGEVTQLAWRNAGEEWDHFGSMDLPTSWGVSIRLSNLEQLREEQQTMLENLEALAPGLREQIRARREASLTDDERAAWQSQKNLQDMSDGEMQARSRAQEKLNVTNADVAEEVPEELRAKARYYATRAAEVGVQVERIDSYRSIVNYEYWRTRCEVEQSKITADARRFMRKADELGATGDPEGAREQYEKAWDEWVKVFEKYPELVHDVMAEDLNEVISRYKLVLDQLDEEFPKQFPLQMLSNEELGEGAAEPPVPQSPPQEENPQ
jgi:hypothetical protein